MPPGIWALEFLNQNSQRHYPLTADASGRDVTNSFRIPNSFIVGLDIPVHAGLSVDPAAFYVRNIGVSAIGFTITIGYGDVAVASAVIAREGFTPNSTYAVGGIDDFADTIGKITLGKLDEIDSQPSGFFTFVLADARIEPDCVRPNIRGISSLAIVNGSEISERLYGDIELVADDNMQLSVDVVDDVVRIHFSALDTSGLAEPCVCLGNEDTPAIRTINGIQPAADGNFGMSGTACLNFEAADNGLNATDVCAKPCCGCAELETITKALELLGAQAAVLQSFVGRLDASVTAMDLIVLGSRLNDQNCPTPP